MRRSSTVALAVILVAACAHDVPGSSELRGCPLDATVEWELVVNPSRDRSVQLGKLRDTMLAEIEGVTPQHPLYRERSRGRWFSSHDGNRLAFCRLLAPAPRSCGGTVGTFTHTNGHWVLDEDFSVTVC